MRVEYLQCVAMVVSLAIIGEYHVLKPRFLQPRVGLCHSGQPGVDIDGLDDMHQIKVRKWSFPLSMTNFYLGEPPDEYSGAHYIAIYNENPLPATRLDPKPRLMDQGNRIPLPMQR